MKPRQASWQGRPAACRAFVACRPSTLLCAWFAATCCLALEPNKSAEASKAWPDYTRGKGNYSWCTSLRQRMNGVTVAGANERLRRVMHKLKSGKRIHITAVGASITMGVAQLDGLPWPTYVYNYMADQYGSELVNGSIGGMGGTTSHYMSLCSKMYVPEDTDIVVVEFAVNDGASHDLSPESRRAQERLVRKLLNYPNKPAVVFAHTLSWWRRGVGVMDNWVFNCETAFNELSMYYHLPTTSIKRCCYQELLANATGFNTTWRKAGGAANVSFFGDPIHLDGLTGARVFAELVVHMFDTTMEELSRRPFTLEEEEVVTAPLPPPLFYGNYESLADHCHVGEGLHRIVVAADKFQWLNEPLNEAKEIRARWGMVANETGATLKLKVDTTCSSLKPNQEAVVLLSHLKSYQHMGQALVTCTEGCKCKPELINAHITANHSQAYLHRMSVSQHKDCVIQLRVENQTDNGEHKFKVTGLVVSEEASGSTKSDIVHGPAHIKW